MAHSGLICRITAHLTKKKRFYSICALSFILLLLSVCQFGKWGAERLEVNHTSIQALPEIGPLKIAFFADVHGNPALLERIVELIAQQEPDLIVFGGDLVYAEHRFYRTRRYIESFKQLQSIAPTFAILGNHDYEKLDQVQRVYQAAGVKLLRNESIEWVSPSGNKLIIAGVGDYNEGDEKPADCLLPSDKETLPTLLLSHDPESRVALKDFHWELMLSGHTHGGQLGIPFTDTYISFRSDMPAGLFAYENGKQIFVTRGTGAILGMRFFCYPEINIITIPAQKK